MKWISVNDELPNDDNNVNEVLTWLSLAPHSGKLNISHYYHGQWWIEEHDGYRLATDFGYTVTHWVPLPAPPSEGAK